MKNHFSIATFAVAVAGLGLGVVGWLGSQEPTPAGSKKIGLVELVDQNCPVGTVILYAGKNIPQGWLRCDGQSISNNQKYKQLCKVVGNNVPDLKDRVPIGAGNKEVGNTGGKASEKLDPTHLPNHTHTHHHEIINQFHYGNINGVGGHNALIPPRSPIGDPNGNKSLEEVQTRQTGQNVGDEWPKNYTPQKEIDIMPPFIVLNFIIKY